MARFYGSGYGDGDLPTAKDAEPAVKGKPCTCDNCLGSSVPCRVEAGERLGELWYCRKALKHTHAPEKMARFPNCPACDSEVANEPYE